MGLQVAPYIASPYSDERDEIEADAFLHKNKPFRQGTGVVTRRMAVVKTEHVRGPGENRYPDKLNSRLWVQNEPENRFDVVERESGWLFLQAPSPHLDRDVYLAVTAPVGGWKEIDATQDGLAFELSDEDNGFTVWEVSTSEEHDSLADFRRDVLDNELTVTDSFITYASSALDTSITYDRTDDMSHQVDGSAVDWDDFAHGVHNPYVENPFGSGEMTATKGGYSAEYDWDPDDDGDFDEPPSKTVDNGPSSGSPADGG